MFGRLSKVPRFAIASIEAGGAGPMVHTWEQLKRPTRTQCGISRARKFPVVLHHGYTPGLFDVYSKSFQSGKAVLVSWNGLITTGSG